MRSQKILLTGVSGQVGHALLPKLSSFEVVGLSRNELDLSNQDEIRCAMREIKPKLIINSAAYTAVDKAESEAELAFAINADAPRILAEEAAKLGVALIHFSTDYVYDGKKQTPYVESDKASPLSVYGKSKIAGEDAIRAVGLPHLILRTSWVYGAYGKNFLKNLIRLARDQDSLRIVADQLGTPTSSESIADAVVDLIQKWQPELEIQTGVYHLTNAGSTSWYGFSCEVINEYNRLNIMPAFKTHTEDVAAITTADYPTPAARPVNSCLDNSKLKEIFDVKLPTWQQGLHDVMQMLQAI